MAVASCTPVTTSTPRFGQIVARFAPDRSAGENRAKQLGPDLIHAGLDARGDLGRGVERILQVVFQVPAQVFLILRFQLEFELPRVLAPLAVGFEFQQHR